MNLEKFSKLDVVLVCGLPGSGKSEFVDKNFRDTDRKRINRHEVRKFLYEMTNFGKVWTEDLFNEKQEYLVKHVESKIIEYFLHKNQKLVIDNTNVTRDSRKQYLESAKHMNKSVGIIFVNTPVKECIENVKSKGTLIDTNIISNLYAKIDLPKNYRDEGFRECLII